MPDDLNLEYKRMLQRRGNKSNLTDLKHAELALVEEEASLYFGLRNDHVKLLDEKSIVDSLDSTESKKSLSALKGKELKVMIDSLELMISQYMENLNVDIENKQDIIVHKSNTAPVNNELIWFKIN